jgi:hypothetical protein
MKSWANCDPLQQRSAQFSQRIELHFVLAEREYA